MMRTGQLAGDLPDAAVRFLESEGYSELYPPQSESVQAGLLEGRNVLVSAPTASGKTLIAMLAMMRHLSGAPARGGGHGGGGGGSSDDDDDENGHPSKVVYLSPLRALAAEKFAEFKKLEGVITSGGRAVRVAISTGDFVGPAEKNLAGSDIIVMTNERMDLLIRQGVGWMDDVGLVISDEVHLIGDENRGPTLEMVLTHMRTLPQKPQIVALSATVTNAEQVADWLECALVQTQWRPVPLTEGVCRQTRVTMSDGRKFNVRRSKAGGLAVDLGLQSVIHDGGQSLIFASTRGRSKTFAARAAPAVSRRLTKAESARLGRASKKILAENPRTELVRTLAGLVGKGVAFHHAGLSQSCRQVVEEHFRGGDIKLLSSTPTLAAGVNLPARRVVISSLNRYDAKAGGSVPISVLEYKQLCGRAGRPQYDDAGESITVISTGRISDVMDHYVGGTPEPISSKIGGEKSLRTHVLSVIVTHPGMRRAELAEFFWQTLGGRQSGRAAIRSGIAASLRFLSSQNLIVKKGDRYAATEFGKKTATLYIDPLTATYFRDAIKRAGSGGRAVYSYRSYGSDGAGGYSSYASRYESGGDGAGGLTRASSAGAGTRARYTAGLLHVVTGCEEFFPKFGLRYDDYDMAYGWIERHSREMILPLPVEECTRSLMALDMWIAESTDLQLSDVLGMESGDVHRLTETAVWLLYCLREVAKHADADGQMLEELAVLRTRVAHGIREELVGLVGVRGIGRVRARALYSRGIQNTGDLAAIPVDKLARIDKIGPTLARNIKSELSRTAGAKSRRGRG